MAVTWEQPVVESDPSGQAVVSCAPASGSDFEVGATSVECQAEDILQNTASCSFTVTVSTVPVSNLKPLKITCPPDKTVVGRSAWTTVTWGRPATENNEGRATVTCLPESASEFPPGKTRVMCEAEDSRERIASCNFRVTVKVPRVAKTKFLAFGDSFTEGFLREAPTTLIIPSLSYPAQLQDMLKDKYPAQAEGITVVNAGKGGESAEGGKGRLPGVLNQERPQVLFLLEGINGIEVTALSDIADLIRDMIREAQARGIYVLLSTLLPITDVKEADSPGRRSKIQAVNQKIHALAGQLDVRLVNLYALMDGRSSLFGSDGFHPNPDGYRVMAESFLRVIMNALGLEPALTDLDHRPADTEATEDRFRSRLDLFGALGPAGVRGMAAVKHGPRR